MGKTIFHFNKEKVTIEVGSRHIKEPVVTERRHENGPQLRTTKRRDIGDLWPFWCWENFSAKSDIWTDEARDWSYSF